MQKKLDLLSKRLKQRGVKKVRFFFDAKVKYGHLSAAKDEAVFMVEQYLEGRTKKLDGFKNEVLPSK